MQAPPLQRVRVWDLPTRVFHWVLAACFVGLVVTAKLGGEAMTWHFRLGYATASLLLFRLLWGFAGGAWSRFQSFAYGPRALLSYLRGPGEPRWQTGHSPLGALSVLALLLSLLAQVGTGLFSDSQGEFSGPLSAHVTAATAKLCAGYHKNVGQWLLLALAGLHLAAIAFYQWGRDRDLIGPMWHGDKLVPAGIGASRDDAGRRWLALALLAVCAGAVAGVVLRWGG